MLIQLINGDISQSDILSYYDANVCYKSLPRFIYGFVFNYRGINNIIINKNLSYYRKKKTLIHELAHLELNHLNQRRTTLFAFSIQDCEDEADRYIKE